MAAARPVISVYDAENPQNAKDSVPLPNVFTSPIRLDIVRFVHDNLAKNSRQPYAVNPEAGMNYSAESWGTGRAVARIPRVGGSGTGRSAQGAFGNMCRGGRMFNPTKIWRRWHRHVNLKQRRQAIASAVAATGVPSLVLARGHRVEQVREIPLVVDGIEKVERTSELLKLLANLGAQDDIDRVNNAKVIRAGRGKSRNRKFKMRRGPLIIYEEKNSPIVRAARNVLGVDVCNVHKLNVLLLAPGGTLGRFVIWSAAAFTALDSLYGLAETGARAAILRPIVSQADLTSVFQSDAIQSSLRPINLEVEKVDKKKNPYKNPAAMEKLNPFHKMKRRLELLKAQKSK